MHHRMQLLKSELASVLCKGVEQGDSKGLPVGAWCMPQVVVGAFKHDYLASFDEGVADAIASVISRNALTEQFVLDVGAGIGTYVAFLRKLHLHVDGIDIARNVESVTRGLVSQMDASAEQTPAELAMSYDWVLSIGVGDRIAPGLPTAAFVRFLTSTARQGVIVSWLSPQSWSAAGAVTDGHVRAVPPSAAPTPGKPGGPVIPPPVKQPPQPQGAYIQPPVVNALPRRSVMRLFSDAGMEFSSLDTSEVAGLAHDEVTRRNILVFRWPPQAGLGGEAAQELAHVADRAASTLAAGGAALLSLGAGSINIDAPVPNDDAAFDGPELPPVSLDIDAEVD